MCCGVKGNHAGELASTGEVVEAEAAVDEPHRAGRFPDARMASCAATEAVEWGNPPEENECEAEEGAGRWESRVAAVMGGSGALPPPRAGAEKAAYAGWNADGGFLDGAKGVEEEEADRSGSTKEEEEEEETAGSALSLGMRCEGWWRSPPKTRQEPMEEGVVVDVPLPLPR